MNKSKFLLAVVLSALSFAASATKCSDGLDFSAHPEGRCDWYYAGTDPTIKGAGAQATAGATAGAAAGVAADLSNRVIVDARGAPVSQEQIQAQRQQQQQRMEQGQTSENNNQNVNNISTGSSGSYKAVYTAWNPPSLNVQAAGVPTAIPGSLYRRCDRRVHKVSEPVTMLSFGPFGGVYEHYLGRRDDIQPVFYNWDGTEGAPFGIEDIWGHDPNGNWVVVGERKVGHEIYSNYAVLSSSTNRGINIFGAKDTTGGSFGASGSGAFQQQAAQFTVFPCTYHERYVQWIKIEQKTTIVRPAVYVKPKPKVYVAPKPRPCIPAQNICPVVPGTSNGLQLPK